MKFAVRSVGFLLALGIAPYGCSVHEPNLAVVKSLCPRMGLDLYEFEPVGLDPAGGAPEGSFEPNDDGSLFYIPPGALIIDDDDLTDDYSGYVEARALAEDYVREMANEVSTFEGMDPEKVPVEYTAEETAAVEALGDLRNLLLVNCGRLTDDRFFPAPGTEVSDLAWLTFTACKDSYDASGDGVVGTFDLTTSGNPQDAELASCVTITGGDNRHALNFWGPLSVDESDIEGLPATPRDGHTYSGVTVPLFIGEYRKTSDFSEWEGIAFWARLGKASEAIPVSASLKPPLSSGQIPDEARAQDGVGQLGVIIQTMDTAAVLAFDAVDGLATWTVCTPDQVATLERFENGEDVIPPMCFKTQADLDAFDGEEAEGGGKYAYQDSKGKPQSPERPFCIDYSPIDATVGEESPYRDQCWDGFRSMLDITTDWKFYFLPFKDMRQAGWGRVAESMRMDQIRSVNFLTSAYQSVNVMVDEVAFYRRLPEGDGGAGGD